MEKKLIAIQRARLSFPSLYDKTPIDGNYVKEEKDRRYRCTLILSKDNEDHMKSIKEIETALASLLNEIKVKRNPNDLIIDGDEEVDRIEDPKKKEAIMYKKGSFLITASNYMQPELTGLNGAAIDVRGELLLGEGERTIYPGCHAHAYIELYPYKFNEAYKGIAVRLHAVRFSKHGQRFGGGVISASSAFGDIVDSEDESTFDTFKQQINTPDVF